MARIDAPAGSGRALGVVHHIAGTVSPWLALPALCLCVAGLASCANEACRPDDPTEPEPPNDDDPGADYWQWRDQEDEQ